MMPAGRRLPFERIFLFGLGSTGKLDVPGSEEQFRRIAEVMKRAGSTSITMEPLPALSRAMCAEAWERASGGELDCEWISVPETQKDGPL